MSGTILYITIITGIALAFLSLGLNNVDFLTPQLNFFLFFAFIILACFRLYFYKKSGKKDGYGQLFAYLNVLYNDTGLFIKQYFDSDDLNNSHKSKSLHAKIEQFVPLLSSHELLLSDKLITEITNLFDMLCHYKNIVEGAISYNRDDIAYQRWLEISTNFGEKVTPMIERLKYDLRK